MIYYIADTHFNHKNSIKYDNRPFKTVEEMNEEMVRRWNETVNDEDTVYVLGDFCFGDRSVWEKRLKGHIVFIKGNHDRDDGYRLMEIVDRNRNVIMCHYPIPCFRGDFKINSYMLYGHVHASKEWELIEELRGMIVKRRTEMSMPNGNFINVGVMMPYMDYTPRTLDEIIEGDRKCRI